MTDIAAIILAAGRATRFSQGLDGQTKLTALLSAKPLVRYAAEAALGAGAQPVCIVTGHACVAVMMALDGLAVTQAHNPCFADGMASSLIAGVSALPQESQGALILLGDMPKVTSALCLQLMSAFAVAGDVDAVAPVIAGRRGNPVLLARKIFPRVRRLTGDEGARRLLAASDMHVLEVAVDDPGAALDIDTLEALKNLR